MPGMLRLALALPLCACVLALAACGGGSSGLTTAQYDARVSRLCLLASDRFRELHLTNTLGAYSHNAESIVDMNTEFLKQLAKLKPPAEIAAAAAAYARATAAFARDDKSAVTAARAGDAARFRAAIDQANRDTAAARPYARRMGATGCY